jgi:hypothetical protein
MKKLLLITLISGICFFYYYYYYKNVEEKDKNIKKIKWNDEIIYIDDLDNYFDNDIVYSDN